MYIYKLTNLVNNKVYIGQTTKDLNKRFNAHKNSPNFTHTKNFPIARAIQKHGWNNFRCEQIDSAITLEELNQKELYYIKKFNSLVDGGWGYNLKGGGDSLGSHSTVTKRKIGIAQKGALNHAFGKKGSLSVSSKPVFCLTNNTHYVSATNAAELLDLNVSHICAICRGGRASSGGMVFRWIDENGKLIEPSGKAVIKNQKVLDLESGYVFLTLREAEKALSRNGKCNGNLSRALRNKSECIYNGHHLQLVDEFNKPISCQV